MPARMNRDTTGPIARTVTDAARLFEGMVGFDRQDNLTSLSLQACLSLFSPFLDSFLAIFLADIGCGQLLKL